MKTVEITVSVNGNEVTRKYMYADIFEAVDQDWGPTIVDMLKTVKESNEPMGDVPGFEGTLDKLNEF